MVQKFTMSELGHAWQLGGNRSNATIVTDSHIPSQPSHNHRASKSLATYLLITVVLSFSSLEMAPGWLLAT